MTQRLQKWLAAAGLGSRREMERWIEAGRITVDGRPAQLGQSVHGTERITVDGRPVRAPAASAAHEIIAYHKPPGEVCTRSDPDGRPTVFAQLPRPPRGRWISIGRLDVNTVGLLLFTTDGELAHRLMHPSAGIVREYAVRVLGEPSAATQRRLTRGIDLEDGPARFESLVPGGGDGANRWYRVTVREGRNRLVRRLWEAAGHRVSRLIRVGFGPVALDRGLRPGRVQPVRGGMRRQLYEAAGLDSGTRRD